MIVVEKKEVRELMTMSEAIVLMKETLADLNEGKSEMSLRATNQLSYGNFYLLMPAYLIEKKYFGVKLISIFPTNHNAGLPSHQGVVLLFDASNGKELAVIDCVEITALRTAAVSAVATDLLSRKDSSVLGFLGAGVQARNHMEALIGIRKINQVLVWDISSEASDRFAIEMKAKHGIDVVPCETADEVVSMSDIITTVTLAKTPILNGKSLQPGTHINAIGASARAYREIDSLAVSRSKFYADKVESCLSESSDFLEPLAEGVITEKHLFAEIGDVVLGRKPGRESEEEITLFKGMGLAVEDIATAAYIYEKKRNASI